MNYASVDFEGFNVIIIRSEEDGRIIVFIDSGTAARASRDHDANGSPRLRVNVNDAEVYDSSAQS